MNLTLLSERRNNKIYSDGDFTYKIYDTDYEKKDVFQEAFITAKIESLGINTPIIDSVLKIDGQWAIKMTGLKGKSLYTIMKEDPDNISTYVKQFVNAQVELFSKKCSSIPRQKSKLIRGINSSQLDASLKHDLIEMLDSSPKHKKLCHGNMTPHAIIVDSNHTCIIDWNHANQGNASADIAHSYIWFRLNMPDIAEMYLDEFCKLSNTSRTYVEKWIPIYAASRLSKNKPEEQELLKSMITLIEY